MNLFGSDFEFCTISLLVMLKIKGVQTKFFIGPLREEVQLFRVAEILVQVRKNYFFSLTLRLNEIEFCIVSDSAEQ
jgi:hypothetical protein